MSGTSMATPHVAGLGALLIQATGAEPLLVKEALRRTAVDLGQGPNNTGTGFIQPAAALEHLRQSMVLVQQEVYPGEVACYDFTLRNQGNAQDRFRLTQWFDDNGLKFRAQRSLPASAIRAAAESRMAPGATAVAKAAVSIPPDWAGMEDAVYLFHLEATSSANRGARDEERASIKVKATKRSMTVWVRREVRDLRDEIAVLSLSPAVRADLLDRTDRLGAEADGAAAALATGDEAAGNRRLEAAVVRADELEAALRRAGPAAANERRLVAEVGRVQADLERALKTGLR